MIRMDDPATAPWGVPITDEDYYKLEAGFRPLNGDDRWKVSIEVLNNNGDMNVYIMRNWSRKLHYILTVRTNQDSGSARIETITWDRNRGGNLVTKEQGKIGAAILCRAFCDCELDALPQYDYSLLYDFPGSHGEQVNGDLTVHL
ncbi:Hypothetical protein D9617_58g048460 [Elsinoe fawcettii]|nr:Hypothetical protein D9617_58g048460 [Elsinoe fawcettii]